MPLRGLKAGRMFRLRIAPRTIAVLFSMLLLVTNVFSTGTEKAR